MATNKNREFTIKTNKFNCCKSEKFILALRYIKGWVIKYFWQGQTLANEDRVIDMNAPWYIRNRRLVAMSVPFFVFHIIWWSYMISNDQFYLFTERTGAQNIPRWYMTIVMMFASIIAGATSAGGASIAFPVMTLMFNIRPSVARDFSFLIQSVGLPAASFTIFWMRIKKEMRSLIYCSIGGAAGIIFGLETVTQNFEPAESKMYFVVIWFSFAFSLYWVNRIRGRKVFDEIPFWENGVIFKFRGVEINWKACVLLFFGFLGGMFSAISGSGLDICAFSCLTLVFRVSEKIATPTSIILMAINTIVGLLYRTYGMGGIEHEAWGFLKVCVPVVVLGAPFGSVIGSHFHRLVSAACIYVFDTVQLIGALYVVQPWTHKKTDHPTELCVTCVIIVILGAVGFRISAHIGQKIVEFQTKLDREMDVDIEITGTQFIHQDNMIEVNEYKTDGKQCLAMIK